MIAADFPPSSSTTPLIEPAACRMISRPTWTDPVKLTLSMPGWPVRMSDSQVKIVTSPLLGEHNEEVFGELLGYTSEHVTKLKAEKII